MGTKEYRAEEIRILRRRNQGKCIYESYNMSCKNNFRCIKGFMGYISTNKMSKIIKYRVRTDK